MTLFFKRSPPLIDYEIKSFCLTGMNEFFRLTLLKRIKDNFTLQNNYHISTVTDPRNLFLNPKPSKEDGYLYILEDPNQPSHICLSHSDYCESLRYLIHRRWHLSEDFKGAIYLLYNIHNIQKLFPFLKTSCSMVIRTDLGFNLISVSRVIGGYFFFNKNSEQLYNIEQIDMERFIASKIQDAIVRRSGQRKGYSITSEFEELQKIETFLKEPEIAYVINNSLKLRRLYKKLEKV